MDNMDAPHGTYTPYPPKPLPQELSSVQEPTAEEEAIAIRQRTADAVFQLDRLKSLHYLLNDLEQMAIGSIYAAVSERVKAERN